MGSGINLTGELVLFMLAILGVISGAWWRIEAAIRAAKQESNTAANAAAALASLSQAKLAEFQTHVAENYISKAGFRESMENLSETLKTINANLTHLNERIDRVIDNQHTSPKRGAQQ